MKLLDLRGRYWKNVQFFISMSKISGQIIGVDGNEKD